MATQYGVWSDTEDGFVGDGCWSAEEAETDRATMIRVTAADERAEVAATLRVRAICAEHEYEPADACEPCNDEAPGPH